MRQKTIDLYMFDELSDEAKEKAREWYRFGLAGDGFSAESITDEFEEALTAMGFCVSGKRGHKSIYWRVSCSQGDGACFGASWYSSDFDEGGKLTALLKDRPTDSKYLHVDDPRKPPDSAFDSNRKLHGIAGELRRIVDACPGCSASVSGDGRYMSTRAEFDYGEDSDIDREDTSIAEAFQEVCDGLASWLYRNLEREYEYQYSDECVDESIRINEYEFTVDGGRA